MLSSQVHRLIRTFPQNSRTRVSDFGYTLQNVGPGFTLVALRSLTFSLVHPHEKISKRDYTYHCTSNKIFSFCIKLSKLFTHIHTNLFRKKWNLKQVWSNFNIWMRSSKTTGRKHSERSDVVLIGNFFDLHSYVKQFHTLPSITFWYSSLDFKAASICSWENV